MPQPVGHAEIRELFSATGTAPSTFDGMLNTSGVLSHTQAAGETALDAIEWGTSVLRPAGRYVDPTGIIIGPVDFSAVRRIKSTTEDYLTGNPLTAGPSTLWGFPTLHTGQMAAKKVLVGNFAAASLVWIRGPASVRVDPHTLSTSNKVQIIAKERLARSACSPQSLSA